MIPLCVLTLAASLLGPDLVRSDEPGRKLTDRVKVVWQTYEKVPPVILGITEPVTVVKAAAYEDGGTTVLEVKDARNRTIVFHLDRKIGSPSRDTMFVAVEQQPKKAVVLRGAEEAALYGLLLRWKKPANIEPKAAFGVETMLANLDDRFAAEPKAETPKISLKELRSAPVQIELGGRKLTLKTDLWRDFMPPAPPNGRRLMARFTLQTFDGKPLPEKLQIVRVWVVNGDDQWETAFADTFTGKKKDAARDDALGVMVREGPMWGPDIFVDAVMQLRTANGQYYLLRSKFAQIIRTD